MIGTLWGLALALAIFFAVHLVPVVPNLRATLIGAWGKQIYRALFSLLSLAGLAWIVLAHMEAPQILLWRAPDWTRLIPLATVPLALILAAGMTSEGMRKVTRHPFLWAVFLWAAGHIPTNGDAASVMLFGAFALYAVLDQPLADARMRREEPQRWAELSARGSAIPFLAALRGRARPRLKEIGYGRVAGALALFVVLLFAHKYVIGLDALPI